MKKLKNGIHEEKGEIKKHAQQGICSWVSDIQQKRLDSMKKGMGDKRNKIKLANHGHKSINLAQKLYFWFFCFTTLHFDHQRAPKFN